MACFPRIYILELLLPNLDPLTTLLPESRNPSLNLVFSRLGLGFSLRPKSCFRLEKKPTQPHRVTAPLVLSGLRGI